MMDLTMVDHRGLPLLKRINQSFWMIKTSVDWPPWWNFTSVSRRDPCWSRPMKQRRTTCGTRNTCAEFNRMLWSCTSFSCRMWKAQNGVISSCKISWVAFQERTSSWTARMLATLIRSFLPWDPSSHAGSTYVAYYSSSSTDGTKPGGRSNRQLTRSAISRCLSSSWAA